MMSVQEQITKMKKIETAVLNYIEKDSDIEEMQQNLIHQIIDLNILSNKHVLKSFLYLLSKIINNHYRTSYFFEKIEAIFKYFQIEIKKHFTSDELYKIYSKCPRFLLFLFSEKIIETNSKILDNMTKEVFIYLFPEKSISMNYIEELPSNFEEKQKIGENDDLICEIIRKDSIEEFIIYVTKTDYSLTANINSSLFETNSFLIKQKNTTLIEYSAFFGSTQIFKYLYKNGVKLTPSLWLYSIHSDNPEMIDLLENNKIQPEDETYQGCLKESIKCHHNNIANYIKTNFIIENIDTIDFNKKYNENIYYYCFHYYNFSYFPHEININNKFFFYYACQYDYYNIVEYFLKSVKISWLFLLAEKIIETNSKILDNMTKEVFIYFR